MTTFGGNFNRPLRGLASWRRIVPSDKSLGYCRSSAPRTLILFVCLVSSGCAGVQSALDPAGAQARHIDGLWWLMFYLLSAVFLIVMAAVMYAAFRKSKNAASERRAARTVTIATVLTIVILFVLLTSSFFVGRAIYSNPANDTDALTIEITGHQWWWTVRYANKLPSQIVTTANEIHIPVGRDVHFKLNSTDVIHSFWVPNLHGKTDLIPGHPSETWIHADRTGTYRGQCAEYCGHQHAHMAFAVVVETEQQFKAWYDAQLNSAVPPSTSQQARGQQVFLSKPCVMCHRIQGTDAGGNLGPDLTHVAGRQTIAAGTLANTREHLAQWITDAQQFKPGSRMPANPMSAEDLQALLDYLESLK